MGANKRMSLDKLHSSTKTQLLVYQYRQANVKLMAYKRSRKDRYVDHTHQRTRNRQAITLKQYQWKSKAYTRSLEFKTGMLWYALEVDLRKTDSYSSFKRPVKIELKDKIPVVA